MGFGYEGGDPADYPQSSIGFDYDEVDRRLELSYCGALRAPAAVVISTTADALIRLIDFIINSDNYLLRCDVIVAGSGLALCMGMSYTEIAKKHGISKQAFDKHVLKFQKDFHLPVTRAQKSPQARVSYRKTQLERVERLRQKQQQQKERTELVWQNSSKKVAKAQ